VTVRIITLTGDPDVEAALATRLDGRSEVELYMRCMDRVGALAALRVGGLDAVVTVGAPAWLDRELIEQVRTAGASFVGMADDPFEAERLLRLGALLVAPDGDIGSIVAACSSPAPPSSIDAPETERGKLVAFWGPKGSPGRTRLAIETAFALAQTRPATALVDADTYGGDILQLLGVQEELPTIVWAARMALKNELDLAHMSGSLRRVSSVGPVLLPGIARSELWPEVSSNGWRRLLEILRANFDHLLVDTGFCLEPDDASSSEGRNRVARTTVSESDHVAAVLSADAAGLRHFLWGFDQLRELIDPDRILVVANRVEPGSEGEVVEILRRRIGKRPFVSIPPCERESRGGGGPARARVCIG
jgi:Mrp family chromosome partitioning ATPase